MSVREIIEAEAVPQKCEAGDAMIADSSFGVGDLFALLDVSVISRKDARKGFGLTGSFNCSKPTKYWLNR